MAIYGPGTCWCAEAGSPASSIPPSIAAIYCGHPEIELAFATLFGTFGAAFFDAYQERLKLEPGFHEERRDIYNLYPRLVHVRLFGSGYLSGIEATLARLGI
jgi:fructosamine-3-kinase